jgi:tetratricopeptide (TPR) repeat protein
MLWSPVGGLTVTHYKAFISYSHTDEKVVQRLHRDLEAFRLPGRAPTGPRYPLRPVFRDRDELASSSDLGDTLIQALTASDNLIVVCSKHSAASQWVNAETEHFLSLGRADRIYAVSVESPPVFPPAFAEHGREPLAADLLHDGRRATVLKLAAGMLGIPYDGLRRRHEQRRQRRLLAIASAATAGLILTSGLAIAALIARDRAEVARQDAVAAQQTAEQVTEFLIDILNGANPKDRSPDEISIREVLDQGYAMAETRLADEPLVRARVLTAIGLVYNTLALYTQQLELQRAVLEALQEAEDAPSAVTGRAMLNYASALNTNLRDGELQAEKQYLATIDYLNGLEQPDHYLMGTAHIGLGLIYLWRSTDEHKKTVPILEKAIAHFHQMATPDQVKLGWAHQNIALYYLNQNEPGPAIDWLDAANTIARDHAADDLSLNSTIRMNLAEAHLSLNSAEQAIGLLEDLQPKLVNVLGQSHPRAVLATRLLGNCAVQIGDLEAADRWYGKALVMAADADPTIRELMKAKITTYLGDLAMVRGQSAQADTLWRQALDIYQGSSDGESPRELLLAHDTPIFPPLDLTSK